MLETQRDSGNPRRMLEIQGKLELPEEAGISRGMFGTPGGGWNSQTASQGMDTSQTGLSPSTL